MKMQERPAQEVDAEQSDDNEEEGPMLSVVDSVECQSLASKTVFPSDLLDLVVSLRPDPMSGFRTK